MDLDWLCASSESELSARETAAKGSEIVFFSIFSLLLLSNGSTATLVDAGELGTLFIGELDAVEFDDDELKQFPDLFAEILFALLLLLLLAGMLALLLLAYNDKCRSLVDMFRLEQLEQLA
jgi:hypothetical protein